MVAWADHCPHCDEPLPARGNRRVRVPARGGKRLLVHGQCAAAIERQGELDVDARADDERPRNNADEVIPF